MFYPRNFGKIESGHELEKALETQRRESMNLHEECLLKYLKSPDELGYSTDILKINNEILEQHFLLENFLTKNLNLGYNNK